VYIKFHIKFISQTCRYGSVSGLFSVENHGKVTPV